MSIWDDLDKEMNNRPWHEKLWARMLLSHWICRTTVRHVILKEPKNTEAINETVRWIKDDIEFGFTKEDIYDKINLGQYGNTPSKP